jgi:hypothetical protein
MTDRTFEDYSVAQRRGAKLSAGVRHTFDASATTDAVTLTGVASTDVIVATVNVAGSNGEVVKKAEYSAANTVLVTLDTAGESGTTVVSVAAFKPF